MNFGSLFLQADFQNLAENGPVVTDKQVQVSSVIDLRQGQEITLTFNLYISSLTHLVSGNRLQ